MAEILVLAEHAGGEVKKVTYELITLARRFGEPAVVWTGPGAEEGQARLRGVRRGPGLRGRRRATSTTTWSRRRPSCWPSWSREKSPALVLVAGTAAGQGDRGPARGQDRLRACSPTRWTCSRATTARSPSSPSSAARRSSTPGSGGARRSSRCGPTRSRPSPRPARPSFRRCRWPSEAAGAKVTGPGGGRARRAPRPDRGVDRGLRRTRHRRGRGLRDHRAARGRARRGRRRVARGDRRRLVPAPVPGRPDRQDRLAAAVHGDRHLRRDPAPGRHADLQDDHRRQQGRRRPRSSSWPTSAWSATCSRWSRSSSRRSASASSPSRSVLSLPVTSVSSVSSRRLG